MPPRLTLAAIGGAISDLPDVMKIGSALLVVVPLTFALAGAGWAGLKAPARIEAHIAQNDSTRREQRQADSAIITELRESNRLAKCNLKFRTYEDRLNCAVTP